MSRPLRSESQVDMTPQITSAGCTSQASAMSLRSANSPSTQLVEILFRRDHAVPFGTLFVILRT
jgi:hypothetical protein